MHGKWIWIFLILGLYPAAAVQITEFCPDPYRAGDPDEYIVLSGSGSLDGIIVSDMEGGFRFPAGSRIAGRVTVARSAPSFRETHGYDPDFEWYNYSPGVPDVIRSSTFQLANSDDQLLLYDHGVLIQELAWPLQLSARQGQVHYFEDGTWDPRVLMLGQSRFVREEFSPVRGVAFAAPDCSLDVFEGLVGSAEREIQVNVYEFSSPRIARALVDAHRRGVEVSVLLEGGPVGGISAEERGAVTELCLADIPVRMMASGNALHPPYRFDHAKYLVIDRSRVLITSENFKSGGFPEEGLSGNRGWGVVLEDEGVAGYFSSVFAYDSTGAWSGPAWFGGGGTEHPVSPGYREEFPPFPFENARVIPVLSPDTSYLISELIKGSEISLDIEQAYITNRSDGSFNPYLHDAINASRRGVSVRILLDSYYYNTEGPEDNDEMVRCINLLAGRENLPLEARLADLGANNVEKIHNKGVISDGRKVLVSSINWNDNSPFFNRESGAIIEHEGVGSYFTRVFEDDWAASDNAAGQEGPDLLKVGLALLVLVTLGILAFLKRRTRFR